MSKSRTSVLRALNAKTGRGLAARRAMAAYAAEENWSEGQLKKEGVGFTAIGALILEAGCSDSLASKMRGFAHPLVRSKFSAAENAAARLSKKHGGAVLSYLDQISMQMRRNKLSAAAAEKLISEGIAKREAADTVRARLEAFRTWVEKSALLPGRVGLLEREALLQALDGVLRGYTAPRSLSDLKNSGCG